MEFIMRIFKTCVWLLGVISSLALSMDAVAGVKGSYWPIWDRSDETNSVSIDHQPFDQLLATYVVVNHASGINRFRYAEVSVDDRKKLRRYIAQITRIDPRNYRRSEQKAYWLNLYNAVMLSSVLQQYPVKSLALDAIKRKRKIRVAGEKLSLADIERRILQPLWQDRRIIFGLSCAAISCPHIQQQAYTASNTGQLLERSAREFINHPRAVSLDKKKLHTSSIFQPGEQDFGSSKRMVKFFAHYAEDLKALYLLGFSGEISYNFDSRLNAPETSWSP